MIFRSGIKKIYKKTNDNILLIPFKRIYDYYRYRIVSDRTYLRRKYKEKFGRYPDLNNPKLFTEKLQWLKLYDRSSLHTQCADKLAVRDFVKKRIGESYLIPLIWSINDVDFLRKENLPNYPVIIKVNHDSGGTSVVWDKEKCNFLDVRNKIKKALKSNYYYYSKEWQYKHIEKKILVEKLLIDDNGNIPIDYKVFCFNGEPRMIQVDIDRFTKHSRNIYDLSWNLLPFELKYPNGDHVPKPIALDKIIFFARKLASDFKFARIDFYLIKDLVYFGEITFHPESGFGRISPSDWDKNLGDMLHLKT